MVLAKYIEQVPGAIDEARRAMVTAESKILVPRKESAIARILRSLSRDKNEGFTDLEEVKSKHTGWVEEGQE